MKSTLPALTLVVTLAGTQAAIAQVPPEQALSTFTVHDPELELSLWASEPLFANPTSMDIDHLGRVWVCEAVNYRQIFHGQPVLRPEGDRILILEDASGKGRADKVTVFAQSPEIQAPLGIAVTKDPVGPGWKVYVCQSPNIYLFEDKDGDGHADGPPKKLLTGFGGVDHDHGVHGILIGPDDKLYFSVGDQGVKDLQSSDGKGRKWTTNHTDCQAGTIWRCDLDGRNLELIAHNFRNEYEPCVDSFGTIFVSDNDDDGNQQTRICYVMPGGNYGYWPRGPGQSHWHEEQPGVVPKILRTYFGSPTGMCVYEGTLLPKKYWGQLLHTDAGPRHVRCYHLKTQGAGYDVEREDIVTSTDNWFRPSDVCVAPDGSVFVADWYDPGVGGHGMGDTTRGRIYRLAPKGYKYRVPKVDLESKDGLLAAFASPNLALRAMAIAKLRPMKPWEQLAVLEPAARQAELPWVRARALWQLARISHNANHLAARQLLMNVLATTSDPPTLELFLRLRKDTFKLSPADLTDIDRRALLERPACVLREALLLLRDEEPDKAKPLIYDLAKKYDGKDRFYLAAIGIAVGTDPKRRAILLADFDKHFPDWNEKTANLIWELRPPSVLPRLEKQLGDASLPAAQRGQIVDILAASTDNSGAKALLHALATEKAPAVREKIVAHLQQSLPGQWRDFRRSPELTAAFDQLLTSADAATGLALIAAAERTDLLDKVSEIIADPSRSLAVRREAVLTLGALPVVEAVAALDKLLKMPEPGPLGLAAVQALGRHLEARGRNNPTLIPALDVLKALITSGKIGSAEARQAAVSALSGTRAGSQWLLDRHAKKQLPSDLLADVGRLLRNSPFPDLRNRALIAFPLADKLDQAKLPSIAVLAVRRGDAGRGKAILAASLTGEAQCLKCHTVQGVGGAIGPDLSTIGKKASRENLYESILTPSKAIADQYVQWQIATRRGIVMTGLIVEETTDTVTLRDANGKDARLQKSEIEARDKLSVSLMPEDIARTLTVEQLVDVVEYLTTLQAPAGTPAPSK